MKDHLMSWYLDNLGEGWFKALEPFLNTTTMENIGKTVSVHRSRVQVYPERENLFKAFKLTPLENVRVVILGQDPYHGMGQATGLAFAVPDGIPVPPSLKVIGREIVQEGINSNYGRRNWSNLEHWAEQGVLLLNTSLTVQEKTPGSHVDLWQPFTQAVFEVLQEKTGLIYVLWGNHAKVYKSFIKEKFNHILEAYHPAAEAYGSGGFLGCGHFNKINKIIEDQNGPEFKILW